MDEAGAEAAPSNRAPLGTGAFARSEEVRSTRRPGASGARSWSAWWRSMRCALRSAGLLQHVRGSDRAGRNRAPNSCGPANRCARRSRRRLVHAPPGCMVPGGSCGRGGSGRRWRLKIAWACPVPVRSRPPAPRRPQGFADSAGQAQLHSRARRYALCAPDVLGRLQQTLSSAPSKISTPFRPVAAGPPGPRSQVSAIPPGGRRTSARPRRLYNHASSLTTLQGARSGPSPQPDCAPWPPR